MDIIEKRVRRFVEDIQHPKQKKKVNINDLEQQLHQQIESYFDMDGYTLFYHSIKQLELDEEITPILNKQLNGKEPSLPLYYWVNSKKEKSQWDRLEMLKLGNRFDFSYYEHHPEWQTKEEWQRIEKLYDFLTTQEDRAPVSISERSLELFGHERFLTDEELFPQGKEFLQRIGVSMDDIKAMEYEEPFVFWLKPGTERSAVKRVLIVENLSFFHTCIHLLETNELDYEPEVIIYGEGDKIERSFSFFFRLFPEQPYLFYYAGDLDPIGYSTLARLMKKYDHYCIQPALKIYRRMLEYMHQANSIKKQFKNELHRELFFHYFTEEEQELLMRLWHANQRVPQEVLTIETWRKQHE